MSLSAFTKLFKIAPLGKQIQKVSFELMYKRITKAHEASQMDLAMFFDALEELGHQISVVDGSSFDQVVGLILKNLDSIKAKGTT